MKLNELKKAGLKSHKGESKDKFGCPFNYTCYTQIFEPTFNYDTQEWEQDIEVSYRCHEWQQVKANTLKELKAKINKM